MSDEVFLMCSACYEPCPAATARVVPRWRADVGQVITAYRCAACFPSSLLELRDALHADAAQLGLCDFLTRRGYGDAAALRERSADQRLTVLLAVVDAVQDGRLQLEP
ncbi:MAG TPA: hypothetical protein VL241_01420 [Gemmatimonadales bacterium]|nr:hypothetical protein [Gemmatimonadales bacterium]